MKQHERRLGYKNLRLILSAAITYQKSTSSSASLDSSADVNCSSSSASSSVESDGATQRQAEEQSEESFSVAWMEGEKENLFWQRLDLLICEPSHRLSNLRLQIPLIQIHHPQSCHHFQWIRLCHWPFALLHPRSPHISTCIPRTPPSANLPSLSSSLDSCSSSTSCSRHDNQNTFTLNPTSSVESSFDQNCDNIFVHFSPQKWIFFARAREMETETKTVVEQANKSQLAVFLSNFFFSISPTLNIPDTQPIYLHFLGPRSGCSHAATLMIETHGGSSRSTFLSAARRQTREIKVHSRRNFLFLSLMCEWQ